MSYHEKCSIDEIFVGNTTKPETEAEKLTKNSIKFRIGTIAYDIHGNKLPTNQFSPLFIKKESYDKYDKMMMDELRKGR